MKGTVTSIAAQPVLSHGDCTPEEKNWACAANYRRDGTCRVYRRLVDSHAQKSCGFQRGVRRIIAALQTSLDGFIEGPNGEMDWAMADDEETWGDIFEMLESVDTCILGRRWNGRQRGSCERWRKFEN